MEIEKTLEKRIRKACEDNLESYIQEVAEWFCEIILTQNKKYVCHMHDPPWDSSGRIIETDEEYNLEDYDTLSDFVEQEYTGESTPSFMSGCGLFFDNYDEELEDLTNSWIRENFEDVVKELINEENIQLKTWLFELNKEFEKSEYEKPIEFTTEKVNAITQEIYFEDIIGDFLILFSSEMQQKVSQMEPALLFKKAEKNVRDRLEKHRKKELERQEKERKKREEAEKIWDKIERRYKLKYGENLYKIDKPTYINKIKPILEDLLADGEDVKPLKILNHKFSNSVKELIKEL